MKQILSLLAAIGMLSVLAAEECLTTTDERVAVYDAKDGSGDKVMHFTDTSEDQTFTVNEECTVRLLMVGGGGAGNFQRGGGGGAGGLIIKDEYVLLPGTYTVTVGAGGSALTKVQGNSDKAEALGKSTILKLGKTALLTAGGGGFGGYRSGASAGTTGTTPKGGSGGGVGAGCGADSAAVSSVDGSLVNCGGLSNLAPTSSTLTNWRTRTGYDDEVTATGDNGAAGGGGAGSAGHCGYNDSTAKLGVNDATRAYGKRRGGNGGDGVASDITGESLFYAAGGGGAAYLSNTGGLRGLGGSGVGGNGAGFIETADIDTEFAPATAGLNGTGSGGGGGPHTDSGKNWTRANGNSVKATASTTFAEYEGNTATVVNTYSAADFASGAGGSGALILRWASADPEVAKRPRLQLETCTDNGDATATLPLEVLGLGNGAATATVTVRWGVDETMTDGMANLAVSAKGTYELTLMNLIPGKTYFYQVTASNDVEGLLEIPMSTFDVATTSAWPQAYSADLPVIGSVAFDQVGVDGLTLRVSGSFKHTVPGQQATLFYSTDANATPETMTRLPVEDLGLDGLDFAFTVEDLLAEGVTLYGYLEVSATVTRMRTDRSAQVSVTTVTAAQLGSLNSGVKEIGGGYDEENAVVTIAVPMTPGYGNNIAKVYFVPGTRPWETGFDAEKAILVKTVDPAEAALKDGVFTTTIAKADCPATIAWDKSYYYWVVVSCGDPEAPFVANPTVEEGKTENCFTYADYTGQGDLSGVLPASVYIQDGLIAQWDGIENVGPGLAHDPTAKKWIDHKNASDTLSVRADERFTGRFFCAKNVAQTASAALAETLNAATFETYAVPTLPRGSGTGSASIARVDTVGQMGLDTRVGGLMASFYETEFPEGANQQSSRLRTYDSGLGMLDEEIASGLFQTYSAWLGTGECRYSVNGEVREQTEGAKATENGTSRKPTSTTRLSFGTDRCGLKVGSLRVYNRKLTEAETFHNHKLDLARFEDDAAWVRRNGDKLQYCIRVTCDARLGAVSVNGGDAQSGTVELWVDEDGADTTLALTTTPRVREFRGWKGANVSDEAAQEMSIVVSPMIMDIRPVFRSSKTHFIPTDFPDINTAMAADDVLDGDTIYIENGTYRFGQTVVPKLIRDASGNLVTPELYYCGVIDRPVVVTGSSPENVTLDCKGYGGLLIAHSEAVVKNLSIKSFSQSSVDAKALVLSRGTADHIVIDGESKDVAPAVGSYPVFCGPAALLTDSVIRGIKNDSGWDSHYLMVTYGTTFRRVTFESNRCNTQITAQPKDSGYRTRFEDCVWCNNWTKNTTSICTGNNIDFVGCVMTGSTGSDNAGGMSVSGLWTFSNCVLTNNTAGGSGTLISLTNNGRLCVTNTLIARNTSKQYGIVKLQQGVSVEFVNTTIAHNETTEGTYCATINGDGTSSNRATVRFVNSILWNNTAGGVVKELMGTYANTDFEAFYSCLSSGTALTGECLTFKDPDFVNVQAGDFRLGHGSSCIDVGQTPGPTEIDLDGKARPIDGSGDGHANWDIGCYEADAPEIPLRTSVVLHDEEGVAPSSSVVSVTVTGSQLTGLDYEWWAIRTSGATVTTNVVSGVGAEYTFTDLPLGNYTFVSVVRNDQGFAVTNAADKAFLSLAETAYVSTTGSAAWPYATPETAARTLMEAIPVAQTVRVLPGTYSFDHFVDATTGQDCQSVLARGVTVKGADDPSDIVIDCAGKGGFVLNHPNASLNGMTFVNSQLEADSGRTLDVQAGAVSNIVIRGGGIEAPAQPIPFLYVGEYGRATDVTISNCEVNATATNTGLINVLGGVLENFAVTDNTSQNTLIFTTKAASGSRPQIRNGRVSNNTHKGSGVRLEFSDATVLEVSGNTAVNGNGSALTLHGSTAERCRVLGNRCSAAVYSSVLWGNDEAILRNSLVMNNQTKARPAVDSVDGSTHTTVENCTIVFNAAESGPAGGVACNVSKEFSTHFNLINSIVWGNTVAGVPNDAGEVRETCNYSHSCFREAAAYPAADNLSADPLLKPNGKLTGKSPCLDIGSVLPWHATGVDLDGNDRVRGKGVDLGCYEFRSNPLVIIFR